MDPKCKLYCQEDFVAKILASQPTLYPKYEQILHRDMISSNPVLCFCPGPDCQTIIYSVAGKAHRVTCEKCKTVFCFQCGQNYHAPATCEVIKKWLRKCADDSETANYIRFVVGLLHPFTLFSAPTPRIVRSVMPRSRRTEDVGSCMTRIISAMSV